MKFKLMCHCDFSWNLRPDLLLSNCIRQPPKIHSLAQLLGNFGLWVAMMTNGRKGNHTALCCLADCFLWFSGPPPTGCPGPQSSASHCLKVNSQTLASHPPSKRKKKYVYTLTRHKCPYLSLNMNPLPKERRRLNLTVRHAIIPSLGCFSGFHINHLRQHISMWTQ